MENREIPARHIHSMVILLDSDPIGSHDFVVSSLYYLACWAENKVDAGPNGPDWHDQDAKAEYVRLVRDTFDFVDGDVEPPPALSA
jgi:hypothetical protein